MPALILKTSISLDGYMEPANGNARWITAGRSPDSGAWTLDTVSNAGTHLIGAETYRVFADLWPNDTSPFAAPMNDIPKVVFSNSLETADWPETTIARGDLAESVAKLKAERTGGYLLAQGGTRFARSLVKTGLIDEYRLVVHPIVVGEGARLFDEPLDLEPISTTAFSAGAVAHVFRPKA